MRRWVWIDAGWTRLGAALLIVLASALFTPRVSAQALLASMLESPNQPMVTQEDIDLLKAQAKFSDEQFEGAKSLLDGYNTAFEALNKKTQRSYETADMRNLEWNDPKKYAEVKAATERMRAGAIVLERDFFNDLSALLTPEQKNVWPEFDKRRRVRLLLPQIQRPLANCQMQAVVKDVLKADPSAEIADLLSKYEEEIDAALVARKSTGLNFNRWGEEERAKPFDELSRRFEAVRDADKRLFDIQTRYLKLIGDALPEDKRAAFVKKVRTDCLDFVYRDSRRRKRMNQTTTVEGLTDDQVASMKNMISQSDHRVETLQDGFFEEWSKTEFRRTLAEEDRGINYPDWDHFRNKRRDIEQETLDRLLAMLSKEQRNAYDDGVFRQEKKKDGAPGGNDNGDSGGDD